MESITIDELKQKRIWVCWRFEKRKEKQTKVPITASGSHTGTDESHSKDWMTYQEAQEATRKNGCKGVGFVIPKGFFFLDADDKQLDDPFIQLLLERFQSYTEWSVSGTGIHIYGQCDFSRLPTAKTKDGKLKIDSAHYYVKNPNNQLELYAMCTRVKIGYMRHLLYVSSSICAKTVFWRFYRRVLTAGSRRILCAKTVFWRFYHRVLVGLR